MSELTGEPVRLGVLFALWALGIWVGSASVAAWVAWERGRQPATWFLLAIFLSPLVALIALGTVPAHRPVRRRAAGAAAERGEARMSGAHTKDTRWDVVTSVATTTRRP